MKLPGWPKLPGGAIVRLKVIDTTTEDTMVTRHYIVSVVPRLYPLWSENLPCEMASTLSIAANKPITVCFP